MKSVLEVSPRGNTLYEMPDEVYEVVIAMMPAYRILYHTKATMDRVMKCLPKELTDTITQTDPRRPRPLADCLTWAEQSAPL